MKPLLQLFLLAAFALGSTQGQTALPAANTHAAMKSVISGAQLPMPAAPIPPELRNHGDPDLPIKGSPLLLISLIGFGLLIGGVVPALRARKIPVPHP